MRFRAEQHLRRPAEIRSVREAGRRVDCRAFSLWWLQRSVPVKARVCVIASSAAVGNAIRRNRAKRRLREVFRHGQAALPPGCDLLLIARSSAGQWPLARLQEAFRAGCDQITRASMP